MVLCSECYIQKDGKTLMLYRNKKQKDINGGKWIGVGGKFEPGESPEQCVEREVLEETGLEITDYKLRGMITFNTTDDEPPIYIFIFTATSYKGEIKDCDEGELHWIDNDNLLDLNLWEGDKLFWGWILKGAPFFSASFLYDGDTLAKHEVTFYSAMSTDS